MVADFARLLGRCGSGRSPRLRRSRSVVKPLSDADVFRDPPVVREYAIHLPAVGVKLTYEVLDAAEQVIARGSGKTDLYGAVVATGVGDQAVAVRVTVDGKTMLAPIVTSD